jgi:hypothetical protein
MHRLGDASPHPYFDYAQRYIELMVETGTASCGGAGQLEVKAPPTARDGASGVL